MPQFRYTFHHAVNVKKPVGDTFVVVKELREVYFYANREGDARAEFLETYGYEPKELIRRDVW